MNASDITTAVRRPTTAWPLENALVSAAMAAQRISWIDAPARALGLKPFTRQHLTRQVLAQLRRTARGRPILLRTAFGTFLAPLNAEDARSLIGRAEEAGARGAVTGLTSHGRRLRLSAHTPLPVTLASLNTRVRAIAAEEALELLASRGADSVLDRAEWCAVTRRIARRLVLGDGACDDTLIGDILEATLQAADATEYTARVAALRRRLDPYLHDPGPNPGPTPDALIAVLPDDGSRNGVIEHVLETVTRALTETVPQALALASVGPVAPGTDRVEQAVGSALRRYPPLSTTVHEVRAPFQWRGMGVDSGTEILYATAWLRDVDQGRGHGDEAPSASLCAAPAPCAAAELAVLVASELTRALLRHAEPVLLAPHIERDALPADLPADSLDLALTDVDPYMTDGTLAPGAGVLTPGAGALAAGSGCARHAALAAESARSLEEHARQLAACAQRPGWNHDAFGEQCRMTLLAHAERCARAAVDVSRAARWLAR
ncbi:hypothetical protein DMA15_02715 [Streptomyces sp. WAC 01529]|uniref:hypothetical protein n=1 Tax=Streptomyces sp. WAC 01529 TaxID=2203205 RepID=UPI000F6BE7BD|nr:hypothetical protein [Streptomyces sp. WAC 01529]AZM51631.1 hypothetical protein DMA15_02715 [Streptomyces sp. WAC 01529]